MSRRTDKVEELIKQQLSKIIQNELSEDFGIVSINRVFVSADLKTAKVYVSSLMSNTENLLKVLDSNKRNYQNIIGDELRLRYTPHLEFKLDTGKEAVDKVEALLGEIDHGA